MQLIIRRNVLKCLMSKLCFLNNVPIEMKAL